MEDKVIKELKNIDETKVSELVNVWERSVRATHHFLSENNILGYKPFVKEGLLGIEKLMCVEDEDGKAEAFMGVENKKIEMLFVDPESFGKGIGGALTNYAINTLGSEYVDANEQNENAVKFYEHMGFKVVSRSELDESGNPFPILNMKL